MNRILNFLALMCFFNAASFAQIDRSPWSYGLFGGMQRTQSNGVFQALPGLEICCKGFDGSSSLYDPFFGASIRYAMNTSVGMDISVDYVKSHAEFSAVNIIGNALSFNGSGYDIVEAQSQFTMSFSIPSISITPSITWKPLDAGLGIRGGFTMRMQSEAEGNGKEELIYPKGLVFSDTKSTIRNEKPSIFSPTSFIYGPSIGIFYDFTLSESISLIPEISYIHLLNQPIEFANTNESLSLNALRAGIMLAYTSISPARLMEIPVTPLPTIEIDTIKPYAPRRLNAKLAAYSVNEQSKEENIVNIIIQEYSSLTMTPLLNFVFFEEGEDQIPQRYARLASEDTPLFDIDFIHTPNHVETYLHILNIIGKRMTEKPNSIITLTGCNADIQKEKGDKALSLRRAESVKTYLSSVWKIGDERILLKNRNLPEKSANTQTVMGAQENRRVEITTNEPYIISPIITLDTIRTMNPPIVRFRPEIEVDTVDVWQLTAGQKNKELRRFTGEEKVPPFIDWHIAEEMSEELVNDSSIMFRFKAKTPLQDSAEIEGVIPIEQITLHKKKINRVQDREVNTFSLVLFDVRSSEITEANAQIIDFIKGFVKPTSTISITGFTDRLGDADANQRLAQGRADATAKALQIKQRATVLGKGNSALYDDRYPEGRLYTRTVDVIIDTKIDN
ncbi:MAG: OmpA family protein [Candidatus Kapaibacteriota bacterium]